MKYCLLGLLCLLLGTAAMSGRSLASSIGVSPNVSCIISQKEATHNAVRFLYYIYTNTPREAVSVDNPSLDLKMVFRLLSGIYRNKDYAKPVLPLHSSVYTCLHPDPIGYYVYTLEKIVI